MRSTLVSTILVALALPRFRGYGMRVGPAAVRTGTKWAAEKAITKATQRTTL